MSATPVAVPAPTPRLPILRLLDPRERRLAVAVGIFAALSVALSAYAMLGWPLWAAAGQIGRAHV